VLQKLKKKSEKKVFGKVLQKLKKKSEKVFWKSATKNFTRISVGVVLLRKKYFLKHMK
jgi:hypothetical protein